MAACHLTTYTELQSDKTSPTVLGNFNPFYTPQPNKLDKEIFSSVTSSPQWPLYNKKMDGFFFLNSQYKSSFLCFAEISPWEQIFYPIIYYFYIHWNNFKLERFLTQQSLEFRSESLSITWEQSWDTSQPVPSCTNTLQTWWMDSLMLLSHPADRFITHLQFLHHDPLKQKGGKRENRTGDIKKVKQK